MRFGKYFIQERGGNYFTGIRGRKIIDTNHAVDRFVERFSSQSNESPDDLQKEIIEVVRSGMRQIILKHRDDFGTYVIHSKSTQIGVVVEWRRDNQARGDYDKHAIIITVLPKKPKHFSNNPNDKMVMVESISDIVKWIEKSLRENELLSESVDDIIKDYKLILV